MINWNKECREWSFTLFITCLIVGMVIGSIGLLELILINTSYDLITTLFVSGVITALGMFVIPLVFAISMIKWYDKKWGSQKNQEVMRD